LAEGWHWMSASTGTNSKILAVAAVLGEKIPGKARASTGKNERKECGRVARWRGKRANISIGPHQS